MSHRFMIFLPAALSALVLSGCGGGTSTASPPQPLPVTGGDIHLNDTTSTATSTLQAYELDSAQGTISSQRGTQALDRANNTVNLGNLSGTIDPTRTYITLEAGGKLNLYYGKSNNFQYVAEYTTQAGSGDQTIGVLGVPSDASQSATKPLPTAGSASYLGEATVEINNGTALYNLNGSSTSTVDFGSSTVNTSLSGLSGTETIGTATPTEVKNIATLTIDGAKLVNSGISGGTASLDAPTIGTLTGGQVVNHSGSLYGPGGQEIGGVFVVNGSTASGSLLMEGTYIGKQ